MKHFFILITLLVFLKGNSQSKNFIANQTENTQVISVDFLTAKAGITVDFEKKEVHGKVIYTFHILSKTDSIHIDAQKMNFESIILDGKKASYNYNDKKVSIGADFKIKSKHTIELVYSATPKKALYFIKDYDGNDQIWTQGQGKYTSNWLPSFDDMNEKAIFDLTIQYKKDYEVIANGKHIRTKAVNDSIQSWEYDMMQPMSSYLVAFAIGKYKKEKQISTSGIPLEMYYYPGDTAKVEYTYLHSKRMFDFLEKEIGVPFPWQNYKQIPVKDFLYAGMENTGTTIFSDVFVVDEVAFSDRNYISVNAHELAHQWFGNLVTETEGKHHWLQEGFATYYALLAEKEIFGEDYFQYKLYESAEQLIELSKTEKATSLLDPNASSLTFYQRGAWALHALKNQIGEEGFKKTITTYLEKNKFRNVTTSDFITVAEEVSGKNLADYKKIWLEDIKFPSQQALGILEESPFIKRYLGLAQERTQPLVGKWAALAKGLDFPVNDYIGQEVIYQLQGNLSPEAIGLYEKAFQTNNIFVRQTIANTISTVPEQLKTLYESLLEDSSYATIEPTLYHLWISYPDNRKEYLDRTKDVIGFNDKNVRMLWLVLSLNTSNYQKEKHQEFFEELSGYTSSKYHFSTRENAFAYLGSINIFSDQSLLDLIDGATHYNWRFRGQCRKILDNLLKEAKYQKKYVVLMSSLSKSQQDFLQKKITP